MGTRVYTVEQGCAGMWQRVRLEMISGRKTNARDERIGMVMCVGEKKNAVA